MIGIVSRTWPTPSLSLREWVVALELFTVPRHYSAPVAAFLVWFLVIKGSYKTVEKYSWGPVSFT